MPEFDVVGVGLNATDTMIVIPHFPAYGGKAPFTREFVSVGGQVASAMVTCARLGLRTKYIGTVGDDERGRIQLDSLRDSGVNIDHVQQRTNCPNQSADIILEPAGLPAEFARTDRRSSDHLRALAPHRPTRYDGSGACRAHRP